MRQVNRIAEAYKMMAELHYRPAAPSDALGHITVPTRELDLDREAQEGAQRFIDEENSGKYSAGVTDWTFSRAAVLALEAFRLANYGLLDGPGGVELVPAMLRKAAD